MFLSLPASLRKAVAFPSRHPPPPRVPFFIYGRRERPAHMASRAGIARVNAARIINSGSITTRNTRHSIAGEISSGAAVFAGRGRWMRSGSGRALPAAAAGLSPRKWVRGRRASNGVLGGKAMGSVHEYRCEEGEVGTNGDHTHQKEHQKHSPSSRLLTLPTVLTLGRVAAVPLFISTFYMNGWWATTATTSIFLAAAITDWLDGYLARKMQLGTAFGAFLDPVADKLMVAATLVLLCTRPLEIVIFGEIPWLLTVPSIAIIGREITMSAVREWAASQNGRVLEAVAVNNLGKWKTATQMIALSILLVTRDSSLRGPGFIGASGVILLYISAGLAVWSLAVYMGKIWSVLLN